MPLLIDAIKNSLVVSFDYVFYRKENAVVNMAVKPYYLKESLGLWYLMALDGKGTLKSFGIDRISNLVISDESFIRDDTINLKDRFQHSYGIWDDPEIPVETVELSYSPLDGCFLKSYPLHATQQVIIDNEQEFRIRLRIKITNDFVMALLSRSRSVTVIAPQSLRETMRDIYKEALKRNE